MFSGEEEATLSEPWWKSAVVYQIYPRSFCDSSGDGVGDLEGIRSHLDHLEWLGVDTLWISPFYRSPMKDFGYDVSDYCDVDPVFGTLEDFDRLLADVHARGMRLLVDWVPNHTSDQHPWFMEARASRESPKRDWYIWRDGDPSQPPNNWQAAFPRGPAWSWDEASGQWYLRLFLPEQPDLNWGNPEVVVAMHDTLRFWLDRGVDGFRMDVIHAIGKDPELPDLPDKVAPIPMAALNDDPRTHVHLRAIRKVLEEYDHDPVMVGEVYLLSTERVAQYYGKGDELHLSFNFPPLFAPWEAGAWREQIERVQQEIGSRGEWPTWVLSNHDNPRHRTRYGGSESRARAAAVLLLTLEGTPFVYAGEELGLEDAEIPTERQLDPGGRDGCRAPIPWDATDAHGWAGEPWLPWARGVESVSADQLRSSETSILHLYRRLLATRRSSPALRVGSLEILASPDGVLGYDRKQGDELRRVWINFVGEPCEVALEAAWVVLVSSDGAGEGERFDGRLGRDQAVVLGRPSGGSPASGRL